MGKTSNKTKYKLALAKNKTYMRKLKNSELGRKSVDDFKQSEKTPLIIILDNVRSLNNIGSVFRTADAFLVEAIYLCGITAKPPHREIRKTALGAADSVHWEYFEDTVAAIGKCKTKNYEVVAVEQAMGSISLADFTFNAPGYAFVFGNEVKGVEQEVIDKSDQCLEIPQFGTKHSFNISISAGIVLWHFYIKNPHKKKRLT